MSRLFKRLVLALVTLGLGALAYALLRTEGERVLRSVTPSGPPEEPSPEPSSGGTAAPRTCAGTTKAGKPCMRPAQPGSAYCWQHAEPSG